MNNTVTGNTPENFAPTRWHNLAKLRNQGRHMNAFKDARCYLYGFAHLAWLFKRVWALTCEYEDVLGM